MSQDIEVLVIAVRFSAGKIHLLNSWDKKRFPRAFSNLIVEYGSPVFVTKDNLEESGLIISRAMDDSGN